MNVFKKGRKANKENIDPFGSDGAAPTSKVSRSLKSKKNKNAPEPKPEFNIAAALPDTNDFRTSLLMPGLSARFSMLKEQDDPNSLLGKASDDSVLFPKRASRLNLFSHNPLTDIAETESIRSVPKPFARAERVASFSDAGYGSDDGGSVMNRSRPGESNNLFGGRQKVFHMGGVGEATDTGKARHQYGDDVRQSPYQQYKAARSREALEKATWSERDSASRPSEDADIVSSPAVAFSKNRGTQSSTNSGPSNRRTSTAATSVATCDSPIPRQNSAATSKLRTSDGSESHGITRNASSDSRKALPLSKDSADQPPMPSPHTPSISQPRTAAGANDRHGIRSPMFSNQAFRANSPPPVGPSIAPIDSGVQETSKAAHLNSRRYQTASPTQATFDEDGDQVYSSNVQPNDRGKATAMGLFNRPRQQFDEQQFLQRQRQMHEERSASRMQGQAEEDKATTNDVKPPVAGRISDATRSISLSKTSDRASQDSRHTNGSMRSPHGSSMRKFSSPQKSNESSSAMERSVKDRVESLIQRNNAELAVAETRRSPPQQHDAPKTRPTQDENQTGSIFINRFDSTDDEEEEEQVRAPSTQFSRPKIAPDEVHPALRDGLQDFDFGEQVSPRFPPSQTQPALSITSNVAPTKPSGDDSPTLGPTGLGLSGMIRTHLRHDSDRSSVYPVSPVSHSQLHFSRTSREMSMVSTSNTINPPASVHSDPWEFDNAQRNRRSAAASSHHSGHGGAEASAPVAPMPPPTMSQKAQQILGHAAAQRQQETSSKALKILGNDAPRFSQVEVPASPRSPSWQQEPPPPQQDPNSSSDTVESAPWQSGNELDEYRGHARNPSTDTQKERQAFDEELADRRRKIQEGLKGIAERDRSRSPAGATRRSNDNNRQPYERSSSSQGFSSGLRHKTSRGQIAAAEYGSKAMKMLGLNGGGPPQNDYHHQRPPPRHYNSSDNEYEELPKERPHRHHNRPPPAASQAYATGRRPPHDSHGSGRRTPGPSDGRRTPAGHDGRHTPYANSSNEDFDRARQHSATPNSQRGYGRDRAGSEAAQRSQSRQRQNRDEDGYGPSRPDMRHGTSSPSPPHGRKRTPVDDGRQVGYERSPSTTPGSNRQRSNSRSVPPSGYFESRAPPTPQLNNGPMPPPAGLPAQPHIIGAPSPALGPAPNAVLPSAGNPPRPSPRPPLQSPALATGMNIVPSPYITGGPGASHGAQPSPAFPPPTSPLPPPPSSALAASTSALDGRSTPDFFASTNGRATPTGASAATASSAGRPRRMTVNKNMISEPTFISSTSSVPLVGLPHSPRARAGVADSAGPPTIPAMNPRRRAGTPTNENSTPLATPTGLAPTVSMPQKSMSANSTPTLGSTPTMGGAGATTFDGIFAGGASDKTGGMGPPPPKASGRSRLRKISSEGGGMASRARQQAVWAEREREQRGGANAQGGFPFPNRSATNLGMAVGVSGGGVPHGNRAMKQEEGGMF